jgi:pimeloyl-ACP methyl ester carboxylesterase
MHSGLRHLLQRRWPLLFLFALLAYAGVCALMYAQQRQLIYLPQYTRIPAAHTDYTLDRNGTVLRGWRVGDGDRAVIYFGGNAESLSPLRTPLAAALPTHTIYLVAYRGYGASDGEPDQNALFDDALALFDQVHAEAPWRPIDVIGRSLGTGVASYLASQRPLGRLLLVTPFDSMVEVAAAHYPWLPVRWLLRERYESSRYLSGYRDPVMVIRAGTDRMIPPAHADRLAAALPRPPQVVDLQGVGHNFDLFDEPARSAWTGFLSGPP